MSTVSRNAMVSSGLVVHSIREAAKKSSFLCGPATKAFSPPPLGLVALGTFFLTLKKSSFFPASLIQTILSLLLIQRYATIIE